MRLLWLKVYATGLDPAPSGDVESRADADAARTSGIEDGDADFDETERRSAWNVKSAPRTIAPWTSASASNLDHAE